MLSLYTQKFDYLLSNVLATLSLKNEQVEQHNIPELLERDGIDGSQRLLSEELANSLFLENRNQLDEMDAMDASELHELITTRLTRSEVQLLWFNVFGTKMGDEHPNIGLTEGAIELLDRAKKKDLLPKLLKELSRILTP